MMTSVRTLGPQVSVSFLPFIWPVVYYLEFFLSNLMSFPCKFSVTYLNYLQLSIYVPGLPSYLCICIFLLYLAFSPSVSVSLPASLCISLPISCQRQSLSAFIMASPWHGSKFCRVRSLLLCILLPF